MCFGELAYHQHELSFGHSWLSSLKLPSLRQLNNPQDLGSANGGNEQGEDASGFPLGNRFTRRPIPSSHSETVPEPLQLVISSGKGGSYLLSFTGHTFSKELESRKIL